MNTQKTNWKNTMGNPFHGTKAALPAQRDTAPRKSLPAHAAPHSPLPWIAGEVANEIKQPALSKRRRIIFPPDTDGCNDRDFAVQACNNYESTLAHAERLAEALKQTLDALYNETAGGLDSAWITMTKKKAIAALSA